MQTSFEILQEKNFSSIALGFFDGIHLGHKQILCKTALQKKYGLTPICLTFSENPKSILSRTSQEALMSLEEKNKTLASIGIEKLYMCNFSQLMNISAEDFIFDILINKLKAKKIFCGFNYTFGKGGKGNTSLLTQICNHYGVEVTINEPVIFDNEVVSSTLIRQLVKNGNIKKANTLLYHNFGFSAEVVKGQQLGRKLGTPTINQNFDKNMVMPKFGVYASSVTLENGKKYCGVTNIGVKPTIGIFEPLVETWLPEYFGNELYGQKIDVRLLDFIREEKKFNSIDELKQAILENGKTAKEIFNKNI